MQAQWPLVGRTGELEDAKQLITAGDRRGLILAGQAGVGKTRLALEALRLAEQAGLVPARVTATRAAASLPFGALAPLLPAANHGETGTADTRADLLRRSATALIEAAGDRRLALLIDDAHHLDDASATLVHQIATNNVATLLITLRAGEPASDPVVALWKDNLLPRMEVTGLPAEDIARLLTTALEGPVDPATATRLAVRAQGNVLFLREIVLGAHHDGTLVQEGGVWRLKGKLIPSERLVELVEGRIKDLTQAEHELLELVSFGEPMGRAELLALGDPATAAELERRALLVGFKDGRRLELRLAHPLYGDVLRARMPAVRIPIVTGMLAEAVENTGARRREDVLRVATWRLDAGGARPELMLAAAQAARWRYDFPLAERLARAAVDAEPTFDAALLAAQMSSLQQRSAQTETELVALAKSAKDDRQRGLVAVTRIDNATLLGRVDDAMRIATEAMASIAEPSWRDELSAKQAGLLLAKGPRAAAAVAEPLLARSDGRALVWASVVAALSVGRLGRLRAALEATEHGRAAHLALSEPIEWYPNLHLFFRSKALTEAGRLEEGQALAMSEYDAAVADGSIEAEAFFAYQLGKAEADRGHVETGARQLRHALALWRQVGRTQMEREILVDLALALAVGGNSREAAGILQTLETSDEPMISLLAVFDLYRAKAWVATAAGELAVARDLLFEAADKAAAIGDKVGETTYLHDIARLGDASAIVDRLTRVCSTMEGPLPPALAAHVCALAKVEPDGLSEASTGFENLGMDILAAEAAADAAVAWRRAGRLRDASACERRATALALRCEGATTPALHAVDVRASLTPAERRAAVLAASGRSNKEIAEELMLSVRTVENRLQRIYEKLGIAGRADLATLFRPAHSSPAWG